MMLATRRYLELVFQHTDNSENVVFLVVRDERGDFNLHGAVFGA